MEFLDFNSSQKPENETDFKQYVFKYGIFIFIAHIAVDAVQNITKMPMAFFTLGISIYLMGQASREHREKDLAGRITFKRVFLVSWLSGVFGLIFINIYSFVALHFFMKESLLADVEKIKSEGDETAMLFAQALEILLTPMGFVAAVLINVIFYALICLIIAAIQKRN